MDYERASVMLKAVNIRLPVSLTIGLKKEAKRRGMTQSQLIRAILINFMQPGSIKL